MQAEAQAALYGPSARYLTETEEAQVRAYADGLLERLDALAALERAEDAVIEYALGRVMARFPQLARDHGTDSQQRGKRDMLFIYRYATFAFLLQDEAFIRDKMAVWMSTIVLALLPREPMVFGYEMLIEGVRKNLDERTAQKLVPYIEVVIRAFQRDRGEAA